MGFRPRVLCHQWPFRPFSLILHLFWRLYAGLVRRVVSQNQSSTSRCKYGAYFICESANLPYFCFGLLLFVFIRNFLTDDFGNPLQKHLVILSTTFYAKSTVYEPNTAVMLMNGPKYMSLRHWKALTCTATNGTHTRSKRIGIRYAYIPVDMCKWTAHIVICPGLPNLKELSLSDPALSPIGGPKINIPFRLPYTERQLDVITCFSPFFYMEHWQMVLTSLEIYRYFGVQLNIIYIQSALTAIMEILKLYRKRGSVELEPWASIRLNPSIEEAVGFDPNMELDWRNQASAHTDCLLKYREATKYIIVGDIDDLLVPLGRSYIDEFRFLSSIYPNAAGFIYQRYNTEVESTRSAADYSLAQLIHGARVSENVETGKYVMNTDRVETAWLHWPGILVGQTKMHTVSSQVNIMLHLRNWTLLEQSQIGRFSDEDEGNRGEEDESDEDGQKWNLWELSFGLRGHQEKRRQLSQMDKRLRQHSSQIEKEFMKLRSSHQLEFGQLSARQHYLPLIVDCYDRIFYSRLKRPNACPGPLRCKLPNIPSLHCSVAIGNVLKNSDLSWRLSVHYTGNAATFVTRQNGCTLF